MILTGCNDENADDRDGRAKFHATDLFGSSSEGDCRQPCGNSHEHCDGRLRHGGNASTWRVVGTRAEEIRRQEVGHIETVHDAVVVEITVIPPGWQARVELAAPRDVSQVENVDHPVEIGVAGGCKPERDRTIAARTPADRTGDAAGGRGDRR
jgi:hypothetical protein